ncbi:MAG: Transporter, CPA2 family [uncultured bacterium]|nr:MAG: Transporter, CPA2 family [uncultured bacterium]
MNVSYILGLFLVFLVALIGGFVAKKLKFQPIIGYIIAGIVSSAILPIEKTRVQELAEFGSILLLFSIGLELSIEQFRSFFRRVLVSSTIQIIIVSIILFFVLKLFTVSNVTALVLSLGFSLSSTAVVVKMLFDRGESETIHGKIMTAWVLVQDLAVVPIMIILPLFASGAENIWLTSSIAIIKALSVIVVAFILGKSVVPYLIHKVAEMNSRELLLLTAVSLAVGTAAGVAYLGISPALGAFIAGFVISESQENHAVFTETRPLRDLFVALFFVTLGFFITPQLIIANIGKIVLISAILMVIKFLVTIFVSYLLKFKGKTMVVSSIGLAQVGEFAFIIFSSASILGIISPEDSAVGIAIGLLTLIISPFLYSKSYIFWKFLRSKFNIFSSLDRNLLEETSFSNHIIILGYGRVGSWVGKALIDQAIPFVVVDFNQQVVNECINYGINAIYGDPSENEVLDVVNIQLAKAVVIAIPDRISQESIITHIQTISPNTRIISRVHLDEDYEKLKNLKVDKLVQPEFEAATSIIKNILVTMGKGKDEVNKSIKSIRLSHAKI